MRDFGQDEKEISTFLKDFAQEVSSDAATSAVSSLQAVLTDMGQKAVNARAFVVEVFMIKGLAQHEKALETGSDKEIQNALSMLSQQLAKVPNIESAVGGSDGPRVCKALTSIVTQTVN